MQENSDSYNSIFQKENITKFYNNEIELSILGLIYVDNSHFLKISPYLLAEDFFVKNNQELYKIYLELFNEGMTLNIDNILFKAKEKNLKGIDAKFLNALLPNSGFESSIHLYIKELVKLTRLRKIQNKVGQILNEFNNSNKVDDEVIIQELSQLITDTYRNESLKKVSSVKEISEDYLNDLEKKRNLDSDAISGILTNYTDFDVISEGLQPGQLIIIAARPAMGKSTFALNLAMNVAMQPKKRVVFFNLEMNSKELMTKILSAQSKIDSSKLKKPKLLSNVEITNIQSTIQNKINKMNLFIDDSSSNDLSTIAWKVQRLHSIEPIDLIIIDYLQLIMPGDSKKNENRQNEVARISRELKILAGRLGVPIIALSQLSRGVESRENKRPKLADLRESGSIEQDADMVIFLYRDNYYTREEGKKDKEEYGDIGSPTNVIFAKNRNGSNGEAILMFKMNQSLFTELPQEVKEQMRIKYLNKGEDN